MSLALNNNNLNQASAADTEAISRPLKLGRLTLKNRLLRSSISGRIDNYDGSGTPARIRFEERFAEGGVAAIISSHVPITPHGRVLPNYAMIDRDERIDFGEPLAIAFTSTSVSSFYNCRIPGVSRMLAGWRTKAGCLTVSRIAPTTSTA